MRFSAFVAGIAVLAMAGSSQAAKLVVMAVNANPGGAAAGYHAFTIGVQLTSADVAAGGAGGTLVVQNIAFTGGATGPYQATSTKGHAQNQPDMQGVQSTYINNLTTWPPSNAGLAGDSTADAPNGIVSLYQDSWWYSSSASVPNTSPAVAGGALVGYNDAAGTTQGVVTTGHTGASGLPYTTANTTVGPTANVGTLGYLFQPEATGISGGSTTGSTMGYTGLWGPLGFNTLDSSAVASQFVGGVLTVPLAQILSNGNVAIPDTFSGGVGAFISVGQKAFDLSGKNAGSDTPLILDFANGTIHTTPEPGSIALAGMGALGLLLAWRRRRV